MTFLLIISGIILAIFIIAHIAWDLLSIFYHVVRIVTTIFWEVASLIISTSVVIAIIMVIAHYGK